MENFDPETNEERYQTLLARHETYKALYTTHNDRVAELVTRLAEAEDKIRLLQAKFNTLGNEKIKSYQTGLSQGLAEMKSAKFQMEKEKNSFLNRMEEMTNMVLELEAKLEKKDKLDGI